MKAKGFGMNPAEVEARLLEHPDVNVVRLRSRTNIAERFQGLMVGGMFSKIRRSRASWWLNAVHIKSSHAVPHRREHKDTLFDFFNSSTPSPGQKQLHSVEKFRTPPKPGGIGFRALPIDWSPPFHRSLMRRQPTRG